MSADNSTGSRGGDDTSAVDQAVDRVDDVQQRHRLLAVPVAVIRKFAEDQSTNLASMIAGCELEKRLRRATGLQDEDVPSLIQHFCTQADTNPDRRREVKQQLRKAWKLRNRTVHAQSNTDHADVRMMIEIIKELLPERGDGILGGF